MNHDLPLAELPQFGGHIALDFANTLVGIEDPKPHEALAGLEDYKVFAARNGLCATGNGTDATLARARALRTALIGTLRAVAAGRPIPERALHDLTEAGRQAYRHCRLRNDAGRLQWSPLRQDLDGATDVIALAGIDLLSSEDAARIRQCGGDHCGWFFLDTSRNGQRRWCSMRYCGNRAKVRRHRLDAAAARNGGS